MDILIKKKLQKVLSDAKERCYKKTHKSYKNYGQRGITICDEWLNDSTTFYKWAVENGYKTGLSLDRIDTNGNYSPNNCRWADIKTQNRNKRNTIYAEINGEIKSVSEWSEISGIGYMTILQRIKRGVEGEELLNKTRLLQKNNKSGYVGINFDRNKNKWRAELSINKRNIHIGCFDTKEEAIEARFNYKNSIVEV